MADKCNKCKHYDKISDTDYGLCLRYPPVVSVTPEKIFYTNSIEIDNRRPRVAKDNICGEFVEKI